MDAAFAGAIEDDDGGEVVAEAVLLACFWLRHNERSRWKMIGCACEMIQE